jgi:DNA polymerase III subunit epsilon
MTFILLDTETTSLLANEAAELDHQPYIVEIDCIKTNEQLEPFAVFHTLIKPPISIPNDVIKIHGIDNDKVKDQKPFAGHYRQLASFFIGCTHLIGHNVQYDKRMLIYELQRINKQYSFPWPPRDICTVEEIQKIKGYRLSLGDLHAELFGEGFASAHSAEADTKALLRVYREMITRNMVKGPVI